MFSRRRFAVFISLAMTSTLQLGTIAAPNFPNLVDEYFAESFKANPSFATDVGFHEHDSELNTKSKEAIERRIAQLHTLRGRFESVDPTKLNAVEKIDREMIISDANSQLLELETIQNWRHNPDNYSSDASSEIFSLIKRNFAPPEERLKAVIAREKLIPELLQHGKTNLSQTPKIYTEVALEQLPGTIGFFENAVPDAFGGVTDDALQSEFKKTNADVIAALKSYQTFLKDDVLPKSTGNFAIGKDSYQKKLLFEEMVETPTERLLADGNAELKRLQDAFIATAKKIDPAKEPREVFESISSEHPKPDQLLKSVTDVLSSLHDKSEEVVTIPAEANLKVQETPPFMRALTFASMDAPGAFETKAKEAYYQVTLPEKDWTPKKVEEHMRSFCNGDLINTSVHEAYPGHYVQGLWMRNAPSKTRKLLYCGTNSEGWAHYCEEMMVDQGADDPKLKLVQIHDALLRVCRYIVGIRLHTEGMTMDQARDFFIKEGYMETANADRETKRGTMDPTYLVYTLGKLQILALRDDYKKAKGDKYTLKGFHDAFLSQGCAPIKLVRQALLPQ